MKLIVAGRAVLIFEGFDEMAEAGDVESRLNHFRALWRFCYSGSKVIITGRPNFFLDDQELKAALGVGGVSGSLPYCDPLYINFFDEARISSSLRSMCQKQRVKYWSFTARMINFRKWYLAQHYCTLLRYFGENSCLAPRI